MRSSTSESGSDPFGVRKPASSAGACAGYWMSARRSPFCGGSPSATCGNGSPREIFPYSFSIVRSASPGSKSPTSTSVQLFGA